MKTRRWPCQVSCAALKEKLACPGMQHRGDAHVATDIAGVTPELLERVGGGAEQQVEEQSPIGVHKRVQTSR